LTNPEAKRQARKEYAVRYQASLSKRDKVAYALMQYYGITIEQYDAMRENQGYACAVCGISETELEVSGKRGRLTVDHNHTTGDIRALLCARCNAALGNLREEPAIMRALARYIEQYPGPYGAENYVRMTRTKRRLKVLAEHPRLIEVDL